LWWLLVHRNRLIWQKDIKIRNVIRYFFNGSKLTQKEKDRNELLKSIGVELVEVLEKDYKAFYEKVLNYD